MHVGRSFERITRTDLKRLARIAAEEREDFFSRHREFALLYRKRLLCAALGGDAGLHYVNGTTGVSEFSVWSFYALHPEAPFPFRQPGRADFGESKFGRAPDAPQGYAGRRVDLHGRSIDAAPGDEPAEALLRYLKAGSTRSSRELAQKALVLIAPERVLGAQVWPTLALPSGH
jgi:hypothetical protein